MSNDNMFDRTTENDDSPSPPPSHITVDMTRLRMRDINRLRQAQKAGASEDDFEVIVPIFARVCGLTEDEVWDWDIPTLNMVQQHISSAMNDGIVKKTNNEP